MVEIVKMTRNGQVTIPSSYRKSFRVNYYSCEIADDGILFKPVEIKSTTAKKAKFNMGDLKSWHFEGKNPKERNLAKKIDKIVYGK